MQAGADRRGWRADHTTIYPGDGDEFNVRYLHSFPEDFIILGEDDSPWAHGLRCGELVRIRAQAVAKLRFAPDAGSYRDEGAAACTRRTLEMHFGT